MQCPVRVADAVQATVGKNVFPPVPRYGIVAFVYSARHISRIIDIRKGSNRRFIPYLPPSEVRIRELADTAVKRTVNLVPEDSRLLHTVAAIVRFVFIAHYRPMNLEVVIGSVLPYRENTPEALATVFDDLAVVLLLAKVTVPCRFRDFRIRRDFPVGAREAGPGPTDI